MNLCEFFKIDFKDNLILKSKILKDFILKNMDEIISNLSNVKINKGSGAGGKNTNLKGKNFEEFSDLRPKLVDYEKVNINANKFGFYLNKKVDDKYFCFTMQSGFKIYFKKHYDIDFFRFPDEAFIVQDSERMDIYIIEKKEQCVEGSVETKLWSCPSLLREYEIIFDEKFKDSETKYNVKFHYILCISKFLEDKFENNVKYKILRKILEESNIKVLYGESEDYFESLKNIINF